MCKLITIKCDESEARGARGRTSHWPRVDARAREGGRSAQRCYMSAARHSQSAFNRRRGNTLSTPSSETKFWSALRPPLVSQCKVTLCVVYFPHLNPSLPKNICRTKIWSFSYPDCEENCENCVVNKVKMASTRSKTRLRVQYSGRKYDRRLRASVVRRARISLHGPSPYSESRRARRAHTDEWRVTIDHSASERVPTTSPVPPARAVSRAASVSSRSTQASRAAASSVWNMRPRRSSLRYRNRTQKYGASWLRKGWP
ncbi:hypothetical protein EVAR_46067_1 [Eumeta japonica]|uniref:Uncharacterized protein n=1 Tax=Eumeta variegata TaxID=151549 RepID=A0A4C1SM54_EUMVA|nr:hypothetical protein EVAR_46067_1 [Eumeta japonica]